MAVANVQTIVATAIPRITDEFKSIADVGWYGSAFFLTFAAYQSAWGKVYKYFSMKHVFFWSVVLFGIGTLICGKFTPKAPHEVERLTKSYRHSSPSVEKCSSRSWTCHHGSRRCRRYQRRLHHNLVHCPTPEGCYVLSTCRYRLQHR